MISDTNLPIAKLPRRFMAFIYDFFLMLGIAFPYGVIITVVRNLLGQDTLTPMSGLANSFILIGLWLLCALFYCWCWRRQGQTLGMKSWRIKLTNQQNQLLSWKQCWQRCFWATATNSLFGLGLLWSLFDKNNNTVYDNITQTKIKLTPKQ